MRFSLDLACSSTLPALPAVGEGEGESAVLSCSSARRRAEDEGG